MAHAYAAPPELHICGIPSPTNSVVVYGVTSLLDCEQKQSNTAHRQMP